MKKNNTNIMALIARNYGNRFYNTYSINQKIEFKVIVKTYLI